MTPRPISEDDLHAFVDGGVDAGRSAEITSYLGDHADVARRVDGYRRQREALRVALAPIAKEPIPPDLDLARLIARRRRSSTPWWSAAAAAVLVFSMGGATGWSVRPMASTTAPKGIAALAQEASTNYAVYQTDSLHPIEIKASAGDALKEWISGRLGRAVSLPDLSRSGYRLMGGRVVATSHGPAGMLMYDDDRGSRIAMVVRPMEDDQNAKMAEGHDGPVTGFTWADHGLGYSLVGTAPAAILHPLADEVRRQSQEA